jgi:peptide/nickel transport system permease protein
MNPPPGITAATTIEDVPADPPLPDAKEDSGQPPWWRLLLRDRFATGAAVLLVGVLVMAVVGASLAGSVAVAQHLSGASHPPGLSNGWTGLLGTDTLGRSVLARIVVASRTTLAVAVPAVVIAMIIGTACGMWAGYHHGWRESILMRIADVIMSFPSLLLAVVMLYVFEPGIANLVAVLALARIPVYLRTSRAETVELRRRLFVDAARTFGATPGTIVRRHILPIVLPTMLTVATLDFCMVILTESSLSFLGIGIQPPQISWGSLVSDGRDYLQSAWWISFFPGLAIILTTGATAVLAAWARLVNDPAQRWRLAMPTKRRRPKSTTSGST